MGRLQLQVGWWLKIRLYRWMDGCMKELHCSSPEGSTMAGWMTCPVIGLTHNPCERPELVFWSTENSPSYRHAHKQWDRYTWNANLHWLKLKCTFYVQYKPNNSKRRPHLLTWRAVCVSDIRACLCPIRKQEVTLEPLACSLAWETNYYKSAYKLIHNPEIQWKTAEVKLAVSLTTLIIIEKIWEKTWDSLTLLRGHRTRHQRACDVSTLLINTPTVTYDFRQKK